MAFTESFYRVGFVAALSAAAFFAGLSLSGRPREALGQSVPGGGGASMPGARSAGGGTADSNGKMIAVTGTSPTGAAVLYLVDTELKRLCVYQASGKNIELVAARNIEWDLKLESYRDTSADEVQVSNLRAAWLRQHGGKGADAGKDGGAPGDGKK